MVWREDLLEHFRGQRALAHATRTTERDDTSRLQMLMQPQTFLLSASEVLDPLWPVQRWLTLFAASLREMDLLLLNQLEPTHHVDPTRRFFTAKELHFTKNISLVHFYMKYSYFRERSVP